MTLPMTNSRIMMTKKSASKIPKVGGAGGSGAFGKNSYLSNNKKICSFPKLDLHETFFSSVFSQLFFKRLRKPLNNYQVAMSHVVERQAIN